MSIRTNDVQLVDNSLMSGSFNIKKADWEKFEKDLKYEAKLNESTFESMNSFEELEAAALKLQKIIQKAAESSIPLRRFSEKSKVWWNEDISNKRKHFSSKKRYWKKHSTSLNAYFEYNEARNDYFQSIKSAKASSWNDFLENADSDEIYLAYRFCKQRKVERVPALKDENDQIATNFDRKSETLAKTLLQASISLHAKELDSNDFNQFNFEIDNDWSEMTKDELNEAIAKSSSKSAFDNDKISFLIIKISISIYFRYVWKVIFKIDSNWLSFYYLKTSNWRRFEKSEQRRLF